MQVYWFEPEKFVDEDTRPPMFRAPGESEVGWRGTAEVLTTSLMSGFTGFLT